MSVLDAILSHTRAGLPALHQQRDQLETLVGALPPTRNFAAALKGESLGLIAEVKRRSPSMGAINESLDPVVLASDYARAGVAAISVLTEPSRFGGSMRDLEEVVSAVEVPVLRKDFIVDEIQLLAARASGAAAVLLIARALGQHEMTELLRQSDDLGLGALVEVHNRPELDRSLAAGASVIGVNSRDLDDFTIDIPAALELLSSIPSGKIAVAESGMSTRGDVEAAAAAGADAVLIGGALSGSDDPVSTARGFCGVPRSGR